LSCQNNYNNLMKTDWFSKVKKKYEMIDVIVEK
jgi:hypothetical protein